MLRFSCLRQLLGRLSMALLLLTTLSNPILASVADLHEAFEGAAAFGHDDATASADAHVDGVGQHGGTKGLLHALIHAAHCCGHLTAILHMPLKLLLLASSKITLRAQLPREPAGRPFELNRPPIAM